MPWKSLSKLYETPTITVHGNKGGDELMMSSTIAIHHQDSVCHSMSA